MPQIKFNWIDILFVTVLIRACYVSFKSGFLLEFFRLLGFVTAFILSFNNYTLISDFISSHTKWTGAKPDIISFLSIFLAIIFIFRLWTMVLSRLLVGERISWPNRVIGVVLGFARGLLLISLIYTLFGNSPFNYLSRSTDTRSFSSQYVYGVAPFVYRTGMSLYPWTKNDTPLSRLLLE